MGLRCGLLLALQQATAEVILPGAHARQDEEVPATVGPEVVRQRLALKPALDGDELALERLLEADEHQAEVQGAVVADAVVVVIGPAQHELPLRRGGARVGQADVRIDRDHIAHRVARVVRRVLLFPAGQRAAGILLPAEDLLLLCYGNAVPEFGEQADQAHDHVAAAPRPGGFAFARPHQRVVLLLGGVDDAVFKAEVVALGARGAGGALVAGLPPAEGELAVRVAEDIP